ncbi:MAG: hypothetical protein CMO30_27845 [Tistrella sp.]|jgi:hypothetical protein|nr:hypothetical protein [Tistrella sp.]MAD38496.1 hypothetical protein [Tistrella sp.]MBA79087.1 hypothetical protein [Tistrella sp.]
MRIAVESSHDVAGWLMQRARNDGRVLAPAKLHALLFLALGQFAAAGRGRLMPAVFVVTDVGPRAPDLLRVDAATLKLRPLPQVVERFMETVWAGLGSLELDRLNALIGGLETWRLARDGGIGSEIELDMLGRELRGLSERTRSGMSAAAAAEIERRAARDRVPPPLPPAQPQVKLPPVPQGLTSAGDVPPAGSPGRPARWEPSRRVRRDEVADRIVGRPGAAPAEAPRARRPDGLAAEIAAAARKRPLPQPMAQPRPQMAGPDGLDPRAARALVRALLRDRRRAETPRHAADVAPTPWHPERLRHIGRAEAEASRLISADGPTLADALGADLPGLTRPRRQTRVFAPRRGSPASPS